MNSLRPFSDNTIWLDLITYNDSPHLWQAYLEWLELPFFQACQETDLLIVQGSFTSAKALEARTYNKLNQVLSQRLGRDRKVTIVLDSYVDKLPAVKQLTAFYSLLGDGNE
jgi:hypothetical protein